MPKLLTVFATATILIASSGIIWKAEAAPTTGIGSLAPLTKSYTPTEKVGYWRRYYRRCYRRGYCGNGYPPYSYGYRPYGYVPPAGYAYPPATSYAPPPEADYGDAPPSEGDYNDEGNYGNGQPQEGDYAGAPPPEGY